MLYSERADDTGEYITDMSDAGLRSDLLGNFGCIYTAGSIAADR